MVITSNSTPRIDALSELGASSPLQTRIAALAKYSEILHDGLTIAVPLYAMLSLPGLVDCGNGELLWLAVRDLTSPLNPHAVRGR